jgi:hypothetical protein
MILTCILRVARVESRTAHELSWQVLPGVCLPAHVEIVPQLDHDRFISLFTFHPTIRFCVTCGTKNIFEQSLLFASCHVLLYSIIIQPSTQEIHNK